LLITEDKDFGELTYRLQLKHRGILLIRLSSIIRGERIMLVEKVLTEHFIELENKFSVVNEKGLRIKK
jgi:predicted nuclease of predicted toxin-antitoxin system